MMDETLERERESRKGEVKYVPRNHVIIEKPDIPPNVVFLHRHASIPCRFKANFRQMVGWLTTYPIFQLPVVTYEDNQESK